MYPPLRFYSKPAAIVTALLLVGVATADGASPAIALPVPQINKLTIYNGPVPTVNYSVQGGSPHVQALAQTLQFTENELNVTNELQKLRLGIVINEQTLDRVRTSQALGLGPLTAQGYAAGYAQRDSALKRALIPQLAQEATPAVAYELINLREQVQTELQTEQKKVITAMGGVPSATRNAQPMASTAAPPSVAQPTLPVAASTQAAPQRPAMPQESALEQQVLAFQQQVRQRIMEVQQLQAQQLQLMGIQR